MNTELKHSPPQITLDALAWLWMVHWRLFAAICGMERKNLVFYVLELSRVYTWLRQWSYTGLLREQSHVAAFSVRLFSPHSWEFRRLWLKTLTGSRSYKMQQTWQRLSISLTAFFYPPPPPPCLFSVLLSAAGCNSLLKVPCNCSRWVEPTVSAHPKQGKKRQFFHIAHC